MIWWVAGHWMQGVEHLRLHQQQLLPVVAFLLFAGAAAPAATCWCLVPTLALRSVVHRSTEAAGMLVRTAHTLGPCPPRHLLLPACLSIHPSCLVTDLWGRSRSAIFCAQYRSPCGCPP